MHNSKIYNLYSLNKRDKFYIRINFLNYQFRYKLKYTHFYLFNLSNTSYKFKN